MKPLKSQTATEYLIITAVVIIIALIVVNVLGGIPGLGSGISEQQARLILQTQTIGISDYAVSDYDTVFTLTNNHPNTVRIDTMSINGEQCLFFYGTRHQIRSGRSLEITCQNVYELESDTISWPIQINWTDISNDASYSQEGDDVLLVGSVSNKYLNTIQSNNYWNDSIDGCHDDSVNPIPICTCVDLNKTRDNLDENHTMQNSIDFNRCLAEFGVDFTESNGEGGWEPIGTDWADLFEGTFDGGEFVIANLFIDRESDDYQGLFGYADSGSNIYDIGVVDVDITGSTYVGGLVGSNSADIANSYASGSVSGSGKGVGGLVGRTWDPISNSYATGSVSGSGEGVGGLVGYGYDDISNSYATNSVTGEDIVGGLVGSTQSGTILNSYATGSVSGSGNRVGGLVGLSADIANSYATGSVSGSGAEVGGLVGYTHDDISNSYTTSQITCTGTYCGGLIGTGGGATLTGTNTWVNHSSGDPGACVGDSNPAPSGTNPSGCEAR